jgi:hypothetical protein
MNFLPGIPSGAKAQRLFGSVFGTTKQLAEKVPVFIPVLP